MLCITEFSHELPAIFPIEAVLEGLQIVVQNTSFQFGDQFYDQIDGTSMGTYRSYYWATAYYGHKERKETLRKHSNDMLLMKTFIYGAFVIENPNVHASKEAEE